MNSYNAWWNDQIAKKKNETLGWNLQAEQSRAGTHIFWRYSKIPKNGGRHATIKRHPLNLKCQSLHGIEIHQKVQFQESEPSKAKIFCPKLLNPFRFILTSVKMLCSRFKKGYWICLKFTKAKISFYGAQWSRTHEPNQEKTFI